MRIWQYNTIPIDHPRKWCIDQVQKNKPVDVDYSLLSEYEGLTNSNAIRYKLLSENPYDCWLDTDIIIKKWWMPPDDGYIYTNWSSSVIFPNGNGKYFKELLDYFIREQCQYQIVLMFREKDPSRFREVPEEAFFHLALNMTSIIAPAISNNLCVIENSGHPEMKLTWIKGIGMIGG